MATPIAEPAESVRPKSCAVRSQSAQLAGHPSVQYWQGVADTFGNLEVRSREDVSAMLQLVAKSLAPVRRVVHAGDAIYRPGDECHTLYLVNVGFFKIVNHLGDGQEQVVGFKFRGDWMGLDGIAARRHTSAAIAMDVGEVWAISYHRLLAECAKTPALIGVMHDAMSREIARHRNAMMSVCSRPADARVADFLYYWSQSLAECGKRADQFNLPVSRADIGSYLGMTLETVSRAFTRLTRQGLINMVENDRREIRISRIEALARFVGRCVSPAVPVLQ
jgi:CRP/FNR family transcriptional regulator